MLLSQNSKYSTYLHFRERGLSHYRNNSHESLFRLEKSLRCVLWTQEKAAEVGITAAAAEVPCWSLESDICWGGWPTYVSTAPSSHKDDNLMSLQLKKNLENNAAWKKIKPQLTVCMSRCLEFECVGGAAGRRRFGSSSEHSLLCCFHWVYIYNTRLSIRSVLLWKNPESLQPVLLCAGYKMNANIFLRAVSDIHIWFSDCRLTTVKLLLLNISSIGNIIYIFNAFSA